MIGTQPNADVFLPMVREALKTKQRQFEVHGREWYRVTPIRVGGETMLELWSSTATGLKKPKNRVVVYLPIPISSMMLRNADGDGALEATIQEAVWRMGGAIDELLAEQTGIARFTSGNETSNAK